MKIQMQAQFEGADAWEAIGRLGNSPVITTLEATAEPLKEFKTQTFEEFWDSLERPSHYVGGDLRKVKNQGDKDYYIASRGVALAIWNAIGSFKQVGA